MYKQVIVVRKDLKMGKGKLVAQSLHAGLSAYRKANRAIIAKWDLAGAKKVVLKVRTEKELMRIYEKASQAKLPCALIKDAGLTQLAPGTITTVGIGPDEERKINKITGKLKML
jgi:PTH2 family peptidyl-tRNA hydrolase